MKFRYCSSKDELSWYIDMNKDLPPHVIMSKEQLASRKAAIHDWVETYCTAPVYVWNEVGLPNKGEAGWHQKITPQGGAQFFFGAEKDAIMFSLKWL